MTTILRIAEMASDVYSAGQPAKLDRREYTSNWMTGFKGAIYHEPNVVVVSYAGTSPTDLRDIVSDVQLATGWLPSQAQDARALLFRAYEIAGAKPVMICGHSLGGALAQILGYEDVPFVTFNAPPMATNLAASYASTGARAAVTAAAWAAGGALFGALAYLRATKSRQAAIGNVKPQAGWNLRLPYDPVSSSSWGGGHVGTVIEIAAEAWTVNRHSMNNVIASLRNSAKSVGSLKVI